MSALWRGGVEEYKINYKDYHAWTLEEQSGGVKKQARENRM